MKQTSDKNELLQCKLLYLTLNNQCSPMNHVILIYFLYNLRNFEPIN